MIPAAREAFNRGFEQRYYENLKQEIVSTLGEPAAFRVSESPVFISKALKEQVFEACESILAQMRAIDYEAVRQRFTPKHLQSPLPIANPHFLGIDFGLCDDGQGGIAPKLIELQAFPSLFYYQPILGQAFLNNYPTIPREGYHYFFNGHDQESYYRELKRIILGPEAAENVILLELFPEKQKTRIDFWATRKELGIEVVCLTKVIKEGKDLFYRKDGRKVPIRRIYNRIIFDELQRIENLQTQFNLFDDVNVEWITHPDWFFIVSKCIMPMLSHESIPPCYYLDDYPSDLDLSNYVLKPLFSFAGHGIELYPTAEKIAQITDKQNYLLQKKVNYVPLIKTNTEKNSKVELRILYGRSEAENRLKPLINLTRMGKGELINVSHQGSEETWIGSSISFFEK